MSEYVHEGGSNNALEVVQASIMMMSVDAEDQE